MFLNHFVPYRLHREETISNQEYTDKPTEIDNCENQLRQSLSKTIKIKEVYFPALFFQLQIYDNTQFQFTLSSFKRRHAKLIDLWSLTVPIPSSKQKEFGSLFAIAD